MTYETLAFIILGILALFSFWRLATIESRLKKFWQGRKGLDLEDTLEQMAQELDKLDKRSLLIAKEIDSINSRLIKSVQKVHTVRFNPFKDQGGNHSFATCFLDEEGNGVVISSLYSREKVNVYAKPLAAGKSEYELSEEEREAIGKALG